MNRRQYLQIAASVGVINIYGCIGPLAQNENAYDSRTDLGRILPDDSLKGYRLEAEMERCDGQQCTRSLVRDFHITDSKSSGPREIRARASTFETVQAASDRVNRTQDSDYGSGYTLTISGCDAAKWESDTAIHIAAHDSNLLLFTGLEWESGPREDDHRFINRMLERLE